MKNRNALTLVGVSVGMLVLILDGQTALAGAREGVQLCLQTVVPSLFPFFVLSILMIGSLGDRPMKLLKPVGKMCKIPAGCESLLAVGFLGGYPTGAQAVSMAWERGQLSKTDAQRMIVFCNNAGPAFLFGMIGPMFSDPKAPWLLWLIHIFSALTIGMLLPAQSSAQFQPQKTSHITLTQALEKSISVTACVCGWVILFRVLIAFLNRWVLWILPTELGVLITGTLELSNGCVQLGDIRQEGLRFVTASALLALGGICVLLQTAYVSRGLSLKYYFPGKLLHAGISSLIAYAMQPLITESCWSTSSLLAAAVLIGSIFLVIILRRGKNRSSIPAVFGV